MIKYITVSPYSSVVLQVTEYDNGTIVHQPAVPIIFRPTYPEPLPQGAPVPY